MLMNNIIFKLQTKLIHLLGGYTKEEYKIPSMKIHNDAYAKGYDTGVEFGYKILAIDLNNIAKEKYGCSKQEWIDAIYSRIKEVYEK